MLGTELPHVVQARPEGPEAPSPGHHPGYKRNPPCALNQRSPARSGKVKGASLFKKDIKNENKRRIHSPHHISYRRTAKHLRHHLPAPLWFCSKKPAPRWQRCGYLCRNAP